MNYKSFLYQTAIADRFGPRELMITDECHNQESEIMDFVSLTLTDKDFRHDGVKLPQLKNTAEYFRYFLDIDLENRINTKIKTAHLMGNMSEKDEWESVLIKYSLFMKHANNNTWIHEFKDKGPWVVIEFKPIFVDNFVHDYIFKYANKVLMMSATVLLPEVMCRSLGIKPDEYYGYRMSNRFPVKNRPIIFTPVGSLNYKNKQTTYPNMIKEIDKICGRHKNHKGIIHSHNFEISELIVEKCAHKTRFLYQKDFTDKVAMLTEHEKSKNSIIVAPAMHEGLDLKDDLARFAIIAKVPYPSFVENEQLRLRMELDNDYYLWLTALKLYQSLGRTVRSETDWAITYILDSEFKNFFSRSKKMSPSWFSEALQGI